MTTVSDLVAPRVCLPIADWPEADRYAWIVACQSGSPLDDETSHAANWRPPTRKRVRQAYGRWLNFLTATGRLTENSEPAGRITVDALRLYIEALRAQVAPWTVWSYIVGLYQCARALAPRKDWSWLYRLTSKLAVRRKPTRSKLARLRPAAEISSWAVQELDRLDSDGIHDPDRALAYRDALIVAILIHCPVRLRNLEMMRIGRHLKRVGSAFVLSFSPDEWKTNRAIRYHLGQALSAHVERWLQVWRPLLAPDPEVEHVLIGLRGKPLKSRSIYGRVTKLTERAFGARINPHLFRDIAATSIADEDPAHPGVAPLILGHDHPGTTEAHYIHANQIRAGARHRDVVDEMIAKSHALVRKRSRRAKRAVHESEDR